jgi:uncharacterized protein
MTAFNIAGLLHEPPGATREIRLRDHYLTLGPVVELAGPIDADLRLQRTNRGILLRGDLRASLRRTCARCTEAYVEEVRVPVAEEFLPTVDPVSGAPLVLDDADAETPRIDGHHQIELDPLFRDELALTEPVFPLCRPDCPGLCPTCGERMDGGAHDHGGDEIDPRLAGLAALLRNGDGED